MSVSFTISLYRAHDYQQGREWEPQSDRKRETHTQREGERQREREGERERERERERGKKRKRESMCVKEKERVQQFIPATHTLSRAARVSALCCSKRAFCRKSQFNTKKRAVRTIWKRHMRRPIKDHGMRKRERENSPAARPPPFVGAGLSWLSTGLHGLQRAGRTDS
jgi:hypothetical protein